MDGSVLSQPIERLEGGNRVAVLSRPHGRPRNNPIENVVWQPQPGPQTALIALPETIHECFYGGARGGGKRLSIETPVPVPLATDPSGYKTMGTLRPGDFVFSPRGEQVRVSGVSAVEYALRSYEVEFDTGEIVLADGDHLWHTMTKAERVAAMKADPEWRAKRRASRPSRAKAVSVKPWVQRTLDRLNRERGNQPIEVPTGGIRTTEEIRDSLTVQDGREINHSIAVTQPVALPEQYLPIDPYLLGVWLGDGRSDSGRVGMTASDMEAIAMFLPVPASRAFDPRYKTPFVVVRFDGLSKQLRLSGMLSNKHVPAVYLRASVAQRIALLQGLLDTDGHCNAGGQIEVGLSNRVLAEGLHDLISGLGIKATMRTKPVTLKGKVCEPSYVLKFMAPFPAFRLQRKLDRQKLTAFRETVTRRYIVAIRKVAPVQMRCIKVEHEDGLFLIGRTMIATHNTAGMLGDWLDHQSRYGKDAIGVFFRREFKQLEDVIREAKILFARVGAKWSTTTATFTFTNGATLRFRHLHDVAAASVYLGQQFTWVCFEEITNWPNMDAVNLLRGCLRSAAGVPTCFRATGNPGGPGHNVVKRRYIDPAPQGYVPIYDDETQEFRVFIPARLEDNLILMENDPNYERRLLAVGIDLARAWRWGDWNVVAGGFFDDVFDPAVHILEPFAIPDSWRLRRSFDWGFSKPSSLGLWAISDGTTVGGQLWFPRGTMIRFGEWYGCERDSDRTSIPNAGLKLSNTDTGIVIAEQSGGLRFSGCVADPSIFTSQGTKSIYEQIKAGAEIVGHRLFFERAENERIAGWQLMRSMMEAALHEVKEDPALYVFETCADWIRTVPILQRDRKNTDDVDTGAEDHCADETRYGIMASGFATKSRELVV